MPANTKLSTTAGPACIAAAWPVSTKMPAPMIAPMPSMTRCLAVSARLSGISPVIGPWSCSPASTCGVGCTGWTAKRSFEHRVPLSRKCSESVRPGRFGFVGSGKGRSEFFRSGARLSAPCTTRPRVACPSTRSKEARVPAPREAAQARAKLTHASGAHKRRCGAELASRRRACLCLPPPWTTRRHPLEDALAEYRAPMPDAAPHRRRIRALPALRVRRCSSARICVGPFHGFGLARQRATANACC